MKKQIKNTQDVSRKDALKKIGNYGKYNRNQDFGSA